MYGKILSTTLLFGCATLFATQSATAQTANKDPGFAYSKADEVGKKDEVEWKASAQAGMVLNSGNSDNVSASGGVLASRKSKRNKFQIEGGTAYSRQGALVATDVNNNGSIDSTDEFVRVDTTTSRSWNIIARYDRFLTEKNSLYVAGKAAGDKLAGKNFYGGGQGGYSRVLLEQETHKLVGEGGYDFSYEDLVGGSNLSIHSLRVFLGYSGKVASDNTGVDASVEALFNMNSLDAPGGEVDSFEDVRINGKLGITTKLADNINFRFGLDLRFDNAPAPLPAFAGLPFADGFVPLAQELDTKAEAALIVTFL